MNALLVEWERELRKNRLLSGHDPNTGLTYFFATRYFLPDHSTVRETVGEVERS